MLRTCPDTGACTAARAAACASATLAAATRAAYASAAIFGSAFMVREYVAVAVPEAFVPEIV